MDHNSQEEIGSSSRESSPQGQKDIENQISFTGFFNKEKTPNNNTGIGNSPNNSDLSSQTSKNDLLPKISTPLSTEIIPEEISQASKKESAHTPTSKFLEFRKINKNRFAYAEIVDICKSLKEIVSYNPEMKCIQGNSLLQVELKTTHDTEIPPSFLKTHRLKLMPLRTVLPPGPNVYGAIRGVDLKLSESEILKSLIAPKGSSPLFVARIYKRSSGYSSSKFFPTRDVKIIFEGINLPSTVILGPLTKKVFTYPIPPRCTICGLEDHITELCNKKSKEIQNAEKQNFSKKRPIPGETKSVNSSINLHSKSESIPAIVEKTKATEKIALGPETATVIMQGPSSRHKKQKLNDSTSTVKPTQLTNRARNISSNLPVRTEIPDFIKEMLTEGIITKDMIPSSQASTEVKDNSFSTCIRCTENELELKSLTSNFIKGLDLINKNISKISNEIAQFSGSIQTCLDNLQKGVSILKDSLNK